MILDAFLFAGEQEMLELRYRTLRDVVDAFVPVSCSVTHQGAPVDLFQVTRLPDIAEHATQMHQPFVVSPMRQFVGGQDSRAGGGATYQLIERQHRASMWEAIWQRVRPDVDDIVMISDVDEIPDPVAVAQLGDVFDRNQDRAVVFAQRMHSDRLTLLHPFQPWLGTTASHWHNCEPHRHRIERPAMEADGLVMRHGGWHLSWFGTDAQRDWKVHAFSHGEIADTYDPAVGRAHGLHANGEILVPVEFPGYYDWPKPLVDGSFDVPPEWLGLRPD